MDAVTSKLAKLSKEVTDRTRAALLVLSALRFHGPQVATVVTGPVEPQLAAEDGGSGILGTFKILQSKLRAMIDRMVEIDEQLREKLTAEALQRHLRDALVEKVQKMITALRRIVVGHYPDADVDGLGLQPGDRHRRSPAPFFGIGWPGANYMARSQLRRRRPWRNGLLKPVIRRLDSASGT